MLHKPDVNVDRIMALADFLDGLEGERFSMRQWGAGGEPRCICGWLCENDAHFRHDDVEYARRVLGISYTSACALFGPENDWTAQQAASVLRRIAVTGEY